MGGGGNDQAVLSCDVCRDSFQVVEVRCPALDYNTRKAVTVDVLVVG